MNVVNQNSVVAAHDNLEVWTRVHLVTLLYNSLNGLPAFMDSLLAQSMQDWRLYVIDNASPDRSAEYIARYSDPRIVTVCNQQNVGFAKGANQGMRLAIEAGAEFVVLINNDTVFEPNFFTDLLAAREQSKALVITPRIMSQQEPDVAWYAGGRLDYGWLFKNVHNPYDPATPPVSTVDFAPGCCLGVDRQVLEKIGLLDESFFVYWEDTDFCMRLKKANIPITYVTKPSMLHFGGGSSGGERSLGYARLYYKSYMLLLKKHFGLRYAIASAIRLMMLEWGRPDKNKAYARRMLASILSGLAAPLTTEISISS